MAKFSAIFRSLILKKWFWAMVIIIVVAIILIVRSGSSKTTYIEEPVIRGNLRQLVAETGTVKPATEINLNFKGTGTIREINVKEGDTVIAGQVLAKLDAGNLEIQVRQASASLAIAQANLNRLLAGASNEDINVTEASVNNAKIAYENAQKDHAALVKKLEADIKIYQEQLIAASNALTDSKNASNQALTSSKDNLLNSLTSALAASDHGLDTVQVIFDDQDLKPGFSTENLQYKISADNYYDQASFKMSQTVTLLAKAKISLLENDINQAVIYTKDILDLTKKALDNTFNALGASTTTYYFNDRQLDAYKSNVKLDQNSVDGAISSLNSYNQAWESAKLNVQSTGNISQSNYETANKNLQTALASQELQTVSAQAQVDSALGNYNLAKAQLELKKAPARSVDVSYYQAQVNQAVASLDLVKSNLDDYLITAPIDGQITFVNNDVGEQIGFGITSITEAAKPVITMLGSGHFEIDAAVPESDIVKVKVGNPVEITLDAYADDAVFTGHVVFIDLAQTLIQDVVYYKVKVALDATDKEIKPGMTANVDIITAEKQDVLIIPSRAIKETTDKNKYVEVLKNGNVEKVDVKTGLKGEEGVELISGLKEGDKVIIYKKTQ